MAGLYSEAFRLQVKEKLTLALPGQPEREKFAELAGVPFYRAEHFCSPASDRTLLAHQLPAVVEVAGPEVIRFIAAQTGHDVDEVVIVELGRVAAEIERLERRRAELLGEVA